MFLKRLLISMLLIPLFTSNIDAKENEEKSSCDKIFELIQQNDVDAVKKLIKQDKSVIDCENRVKSSPMSFAAYHNHIEIVEMLLKAKADVNHANSYGNTPLFYAALNGNIDLAKKMIKAGANINHKSLRDHYSAHYAAYGGNIELFGLLLKDIDINAVDEYKAGFIHWAAYGGNLELFSKLINKGLDPKAKDTDGKTVLHYAAQKGSIELLEFLVDDLKFDIKVQDTEGNHPIYKALQYSNVEAINFFVERGFDINTKLQKGQTVLQLACRSGDIELAEKLIKMGADINAVDDNGSVPINWAAMSNNTELIDLLLENGAKLNPKHCTKTMCATTNSPLHSAAWRSPNMVQHLLDKGANPNIADEDGHTALFNAVRSDSLRTVKILCEAGINVNYADKNGFTVLHRCSKHNSIEETKLLLKYDANINAKDNFGRTPLHHAAINGNVELAKLLIDNGAKVSEKDKKELAPSAYAVYYGNKEMQKLLGEPKDPISKKMKIKSDLLNAELDEGEAFVWYLNHSGYAVKTKNNLVIFDYWTQDEHPDVASINNGYINPEEIKDLNVTVLASHSHRDHYTADIFEWNNKVKNIEYVIGFEPDIENEYTFIPDNKTKKIGDVSVTTMKSNDGGQAFYVTVDGVSMYHAGDHSNIRDDMDENFVATMKFMTDKFGSADLVFLPVTGCRFQNKAALKKGNIMTIKKLQPKRVFPMHGSGREYAYNDFVEEMKEVFDKDIYFAPWNRGDRTFLSSKALTSSK